jgi:hypothetical protein
MSRRCVIHPFYQPFLASDPIHYARAQRGQEEVAAETAGSPTPPPAHRVHDFGAGISAAGVVQTPLSLTLEAVTVSWHA